MFQTDPRGVEAVSPASGRNLSEPFQTDPRGVEAVFGPNRGRETNEFQTDPRGVEATDAFAFVLSIDSSFRRTLVGLKHS